jgi:hypothetical protein
MEKPYMLEYDKHSDENRKNRSAESKVVLARDRVVFFKLIVLQNLWTNGFSVVSTNMGRHISCR